MSADFSGEQQAMVEDEQPKPVLPCLCLDFDGVIHDYKHGWQTGGIYGNVLPGFFDWCERAQKHFTLVIYSSRSSAPEGILMMSRWLGDQARKVGWHVTDLPVLHHPVLRLLDARRAEILLFKFAYEKPPAFLTIDDRAIQFSGDWNDPALQVDVLRAFKPWMQARD